MKRAYLSGPMTGKPAFNFPAFHDAAAKLRAMGYEVVNPAEMDESDDAPLGSRPWADYLKRDIRAMLGCDGIVLLPEWEASRGATLEHHIAVALGMDVELFVTLHP